MKNAIQTLAFILISFQLLGQTSGKISYTETMKFDIKIEGMDEAMLDMIPKSQSFQKELLFNSKESLYQNQIDEVAEDIDISSDDGSFQIRIINDETENIYYKNLAEKNIVNQTGIMGKSFLIKDVLPKLEWKITNEKIKYLDYECQKAVIEDEEDFIIAWFTTQIPTQAGPNDYHGLPGTILLLSINEDELEIKATKVDLGQFEIKLPKEGKKVNQAEFEAIEIEKNKEMEEMYNNGSSRKIGN